MRRTGSFRGGCPAITLYIKSPRAPSLADHYPGIIDTGFDGFVLVPTQVASQLGLVPDSVARVITADGATAEVLAAECSVTIDGREIEGIALITPGAKDILYGNGFLREAELRLIVDAKKGVYELTGEQ